MSYRDKIKGGGSLGTYHFAHTFPDGDRGYIYVLCARSLEAELYLSMRKKEVPGFAVVVAAGKGEPDEKTRYNMERFYGYRHETTGEVA